MQREINAHADPFFKKLNLLKFDDLVKLRSLQFYFKSMNNMLPVYFSRMFETDSSAHPYDTRHKSSARPQVTKKITTSKCVRYFIPNIVKTIPHEVVSKGNTHSLAGFTKYARTSLLSSYSTSCNVPNCYICKKEIRI